MTFKTGSQLPSLLDKAGKENKGLNKYSDINKQFEELDLGDNNLDDYEDDDNFDANELLNFDDYKNKRKNQPEPAKTQNSIPDKKPSPKKYKFEEEDDWGDDWGNDDKGEEDLDNFDYDNTNLNKLSDA